MLGGSDFFLSIRLLKCLSYWTFLSMENNLYSLAAVSPLTFLSGSYLPEDVSRWNQYLFLPSFDSFLPSQVVLIWWHSGGCSTQTWRTLQFSSSRVPKLPSPSTFPWGWVHYTSAVSRSRNGSGPWPWLECLLLPWWDYDLYWWNTGALPSQHPTPLTPPIHSTAWEAPFPKRCRTRRPW